MEATIRTRAAFEEFVRLESADIAASFADLGLEIESVWDLVGRGVTISDRVSDRTDHDLALSILVDNLGLTPRRYVRALEGIIRAATGQPVGRVFGHMWQLYKSLGEQWDAVVAGSSSRVRAVFAANDDAPDRSAQYAQSHTQSCAEALASALALDFVFEVEELEEVREVLLMGALGDSRAGVVHAWAEKARRHPAYRPALLGLVDELSTMGSQVTGALRRVLGKVK